MSRCHPFSISLFLAGLPMAVQAIDLTPGDITPLPAGISFVQTSYQQSTRGKLYAGGQVARDDTHLDINTVLVRVGHGMTIAGKPAVFYAEAPMGTIKASENLSRDPAHPRLGDAALMLAIWPHADHEHKSYLGIGGYLLVPTGSYDPQRRLNMGNNRYGAALQVGYEKGVNDQLLLSFAADGVWFKDNPDYGPDHLRYAQRPYYTLQAGARYEPDARHAFTANLLHSFGGETRIDGLNSQDEARVNRFVVSAIGKYDFGRLTLQYGRDLNTYNGFLETRRVVLRYTRLF